MKPKSVLYALLRMVALFYVLILAILFFFQERLIFIPHQTPADFKFAFDSPFEERWMESAGLKINSLFFPVPQSPGVILYFHGNAGSLEAGWGEAARELAWRSGWSVWIIDYPGYGKSGGKISSETQLHTIASDFYKAAEKDFSGKVVIYGRSIGSGIAVQAAHGPRALILESPFYGLRDLARQLAPWAPLFLLKYDFASFKCLPAIDAPVLILHGDADEVIGYAQGLKLSKLIKTGTLATIAGGHHNDLSDYDSYWTALKKFLSD